jgi:L-ascorbate metabolism protein UlaG (beta-lactamase superfamily)
MRKFPIIISVLMIGFVLTATAQKKFDSDVFQTSKGELKITFIGHGTLMFTFGGKIIHVDPYSRVADYSQLPKADLILITHEHGDHFNPDVISMIKKDNTEIILTKMCSEKVDGIIMKNGDVKTVMDLKIEAIPAYNIVHMRRENMPYHPKGDGNGYIITFGNKRVYVAGDTENTPAMNLPYTMSPEMVADAAKAFKPKILYPYHYGQTDTSEIVELLKDVKEVEVRIRDLS